MSTRTENLDLVKLEYTDVADITLLNENWDLIDAELTAVESVLSEYSTALIALSEDIDNVASDVIYSNTNSNLNATDVQAALDETVEKINTLSNKAVTSNQSGLVLSVDSNGILTITY